jgi:predicted AlkP superfamily phosphohydrolase/phosphomutase
VKFRHPRLFRAIPFRAIAKVAVIACAFLLVGASPDAESPGRPSGANPGVFIMGVDGMDPLILSRLMKSGEMPNFQQLAREGSYQSLGTSEPPQSPVAWSNFVTGMNPGGHGIFDFLHRDPATYAPVSSATRPPETEASALHLFGYVLPVSGSDPENNRGGTPWWDALVESGVDVEVYRIPGNFPTPESKAKVLDGMGTSDLRGGFGTYTLYSDVAVEKDDPKGDVQFVTVHDLDLDGTPDTVTSILRGPPDLFHLEPGQIPREGDYLTVGVTVHVDPTDDAAVVEIAGKQILIRQGEWSDWVEVTFDLLPLGMMPVSGTVRFYAKQLRPFFQLYVSPVNISAANPHAPVTSPDDFVEELFDEVGFFYTQGMPEEQEALKDGVFDEDDYLKQVALVQEDTRRLLDLALRRFEAGDATFAYLSDIDLQSHMLWRHGDPKYPNAPNHPAYDAAISPGHTRDIDNFYRDVDSALGEVRRRLPRDTLLIVMSDHGFQPFSRDVHLNAWLRENGYLVMKPGKTTGYTLGDDVDWTKTRAYGIGFNGLYLNLAGREAHGIVEADAAEALMSEIARRLEAFVDSDRGERVVLRVSRSTEIYSGPRISEGPDLLIGYNIGYGCSDESTLGEITATVLEDNTSRWSGNHLMAPEVVPGILLVNRKLPSDGHDLTDLTATLLSYYDVEPLPGMTGEPIL